jgi:ABC-type transport system involved in cytochrome c biogenesis ATPase subunit
LWILDEPDDALDVDGVQVVNELLHAHLARGATLLTSHHAPGPALRDVRVRSTTGTPECRATFP